jgi:hypothetical protein
LCQQVPWTYTVERHIAPTVAQLTPASASTVGTLTQVEVIFSEEVLRGRCSGPHGEWQSSRQRDGQRLWTYVFTFVQPGFGTVNFAWSGTHGITDTAASPNAFGGGNWSVTRSATGPGNIVINEFLASNGTGFADENGDQEDWIEIYNPGASSVNLAGWALTNDPDDPGMWVFRAAPSMPTLISSSSPRGRIGNRRHRHLHTNFQLNEFGGYLALSPPDSPRAAGFAISSELQSKRQPARDGVSAAADRLQLWARRPGGRCVISRRRNRMWRTARARSPRSRRR